MRSNLFVDFRFVTFSINRILEERVWVPVLYYQDYEIFAVTYSATVMSVYYVDN